MTYHHGQRVSCEINGVKIKDARISIDKRGNHYICFNDPDLFGFKCQDMLGYKHSWLFNPPEDDYVKNIKPLSGFYPVKGDMIVCNGVRRKVLEVVGDLVAISCEESYRKYWDTSISTWFHRLELERLGYKIEGQPEPDETVEVSIDEIAKWKGIPADRVRVKKQS